MNRLKIEDKFDVMNDHLRKISLAVGGEVSKPTTFEEVRIHCRNGNIDGMLSIGDAIPFTKDGVKYNAIVVDFIKDGQHSNGLQLQNGLKRGVIFQTEKILYNLQFDEREAFYYAKGGLSAGTYHFKVDAHSWAAGEVGKTIQFTLSEPVPVGGQLVWKQAHNEVFAGGGIDVFANSDSVTAIETVTMSEGAGGVDLGTITNAIDGNLNSCQRALLGSNNWKESAMRQYLNSNAAAGSVWTAKTVFDRPPLWRDSTKGFLNVVNDDLANNVAEVIRHTYRNTVSDGGKFDETKDKIFLASRKEVFMPSESSDDDTEPFDWYKSNSIYDVAHTNADPIRVKAHASGTAGYWWLQSPHVGHASLVRLVSPTGAYDGSGASISSGVAPAFVIA